MRALKWTAGALALALCGAGGAMAQVTLSPSAGGDVDTTGTTSGNVTTLSIDTSNTGVDLGLMHTPDGAIVPKSPTTTARGTTTRQPALDNSGTVAGTNASGTPASATSGAADNALGGANDVDAYAKPGTSALGTPSSAGRDNGNSGTNNGRSVPGLNGGTGVVNSGVSWNGLAASGNTGAGPAASGNTGAASPGSTTRAMSSGTITDANTAAQAASTSRTLGGNPVAGRILGGGAASGAGANSGGAAGR